MELGSVDAQAKPDRFSTSDEIRAALSFLPDFSMENAKDVLWEVESDLGGHVLIETEDEAIMTLAEELDTRPN
jgi:hypothetical protein